MNKKTNIFVDCHIFDQSLQGTTSYIKGLYSELIKDTTKNFFFASYRYDLSKVFKENDNVFFIKYKSKNKFIRLLIDLPILLKKHKIDFAHFQYVVPPFKRCKYIVTLHDILFLDYPEYFPWTYRKSKYFLYKQSAKKADILFTVSEYSKKQIQKHFKLKNIFITPNGVDSVYFDDYDKRKEKRIVNDKFGFEKYFLFVSRWEPRKNHYLLLKSFVEGYYYKDYQLVFVGTKAIEDLKYLNYYNSLPYTIKQKIFSLESINHLDLVSITRAADLSVYPSIAEGFGIPPLETLACNVPTICSNTTAMKDFKFMSDYQFNPKDLEEIKRYIEIGKNDINVSEKRKYVFENYSWNSSSNIFKKIVFKDL